MMGMLELVRFASIDALAQEIYEELRDHLSTGAGFAPVLFLHQFQGDEEPELLEMVTLDGEEQQAWPEIIREAVERTEASLWALATQVLIRKTSVPKNATSEELLFVYLVADASQPAGARIWATALDSKTHRLGPFSERTDDPRLQMMISHLTGGHLLH